MVPDVALVAAAAGLSAFLWALTELARMESRAPHEDSARRGAIIVVRLGVLYVVGVTLLAATVGFFGMSAALYLALMVVLPTPLVGTSAAVMVRRARSESSGFRREALLRSATALVVAYLLCCVSALAVKNSLWSIAPAVLALGVIAAGLSGAGARHGYPHARRAALVFFVASLGASIGIGYVSALAAGALVERFWA